MLLVHPSSQCDVCLDPYTWASPSKAPHAVQCGHVFCLDCLRSVSPTNCPLCRKGFNPERIKKLHVDKVDGDGAGPAGPMAEENVFFRRVAVLFDEQTSPENINALVEEVNGWVERSSRVLDPSQTHPLRAAVTALHQYKTLLIEKAEIKKELNKMRATHERHVTVKNKDIEMAMLVERNMLQATEQSSQELAALRAENARLQEELRRYTHPSNPLPRPPELNPFVSSLTRQRTNLPSDAQGTVAPGAMGTAAVNPQQEPSGLPRPTSIQVIEPPTTRERRSKYKVTSTGEELRQENRRRPHFIVPGAPPTARVLPLRPADGDSDATPRASATVPPPPGNGVMGMWASDDWPYDYPDPRPRPGEPAVWAGAPDALRATVPNQTVYQSEMNPVAGAAVVPPLPVTNQAFVAPGGPSTFGGQQPALNGPPPAPTANIRMPREPYLPRSARIPVDAPDAPISGRSPLGWRPGPAHKPGYVLAYIPHTGICWIPEKQASKMPVRARGTESRYGYVIAKEPSEVDEEWRNVHDGASPGLNPLQLTGVPERSAVGPSTGIIRREEDALYHTAREGSTLLRNPPDTTHRSVTFDVPAGPSAAASSPQAGPSGSRGSAQARAGDAFGLGLNSQPEPGQSTTARPPIQSRVPEEGSPQPSPATSWGESYRQSRRSSLALGVANLPSPHGSQTFSESSDQVSISEFIGSGPVVVDVVTDHTSISIRSERPRDQGPSGLLLTSREGSSRQVVTGLQDLEDINRSLRQISDSLQGDERSTRSSASSRRSRHTSFSGQQESDAIHGSRTGLAIYSSRPATQYSGGSHPPAEPSRADPSPPRAHSRTSVHSHAESAHSHSSSVHSTTSATSQRSSGRRPRRASAASNVRFSDHEPEPLELPLGSWAAEPADVQPYGAGHGPYAEAAPRGSSESIPRAFGATDGFGGAGGSLMLSFEAPSTSAAVDRNGEAATGIHAPRPLSSRHSSVLNGAWASRSSR